MLALAFLHVPVFALAQQSPATSALLRPSYNFYGMTGLVDMPSGETQPDGEFAISFSTFGGIFRNTLAFQFSPRITGAFRYSALRNWNSDGFDTYYDRSFDFRYQLLFEGKYRPAVAIGLQDLAGTGVSAAEYIVATKTLRPGLKITGGLGWGRLGTYNSIGSPFGDNRPAFVPGDTGGELSYQQWFRGPVAPFAGIEWQPNDKWTFKFEYSSDAYVEEATNRSIIERSSPFNFGVEYQVTDSTTIGAYSLYGDSIGVMANFSFNPARTSTPLSTLSSEPVAVRPSQSEYPDLWTGQWAESERAQDALGKRLQAYLEQEGIRVLSFGLSIYEAEIRVENLRYRSYAAAIGRTAKGMALLLPVTVETFNIVFVDNGLPISRVTMRRSDLEATEPRPDAVEAFQALVGIGAASSDNPPPGVEGVYPSKLWAIRPYYRQAFFDPQNPYLFEFGVRARGIYEFSPGWVVSGSVAQQIYSDMDKIRVSPSNLPPVRTEAGLYEQGSGPFLENLTLSYVNSLGNDFYGRVTAGYLERMFGGISAELLWKPVDSRIGLGVDVNYARKRDYDGGFGFLDYDVFTGHASAYMDWGNGYYTQLDVGRYLAGDWGTTLTVDRVFENGWRVGAFATFTDVSAEDFGEGSFDKGIRLTIPLDWGTGRDSKAAYSTIIRPVQRDGGARLEVPGRLYDRVAAGHSKRISDEWARVWR